MRVIDLFAGAGGFSVGAHTFTDAVTGFELDDDACATQDAAGMHVRQVNLATAEPADHASWWERHGHLHLHASPPCTSFSAAGTGKGRKFIDDLSVAVRDILAGDDYDDVVAGLPDDIDDTSKLVLVPARWISDLEPDSISMEQVRAVLPIWEMYADCLELVMGYDSAWTALLSAEQYGLPQTRLRAWLGARKYGETEPPKATHSKYHTRSPERLDEGVEPWVSMADALGWEPHTQAGFLRRADNNDSVTIDGVDYRARDIVDSSERPALAVTEKIRSFTHWGEFTHYAPAGVGQKNHPANPRPLGEAPAPTVTSEGNHYFYNADDFQEGEQLVKHKDQTMDEADWTRRRPATTVMGDPRIWPPGHKVNAADRERHADADERYGDRAGKRARKITVQEAAILQGFPPDHPFQGSKTSQFRQVGNAVPPPIAVAVIEAVTTPGERAS